MTEDKNMRIIQRPPVENDPAWLSIRLQHLKLILARLVDEIRRIESKLASLERRPGARHTSH